jgi:hypothetical protein
MVTVRDDLSGYRWHTGATPRPLAPGEPCPVLFRDVGPAALARFLRGTLPRLAGPLTPLVYLRTAAYVEPYTDFERTGRLVVVRPLGLQPWHAGTPHVFVAKARPGVDYAAVGFVPGDVPLAEAARRLTGVTDAGELREAFGGREHDDAVADELSKLVRLATELAASEAVAAPWRDRLQSADRARTREVIARAGVTEADLCAAWHHLPRERRGFLVEALRTASGAA